MLYDKFKEKYDEIKNLSYTMSLLNWDQSTNISKNGVQSRAEIMGTITKISHNLFISDEFYEILCKLSESNEFSVISELKKNEIKKVKTEVEKERKIPTEIASEITKVTSLAMNNWEIAKKNNDDTKFLPLLEDIYNLKKELISGFSYDENPYDVLLDYFDEGLKYSYVFPLFENLEKELKNILHKINNSSTKINDNFIYSNYDKQKQWDFGVFIIKQMGINFDSFRQDYSAHPFTTEIGIGDVRITTNIIENNLNRGLYSTMHEAGHSLYTLGVENIFKDSPCGELKSLSLHESQSRFYENIIGRSQNFWKVYYPELKKYFPTQFENISLKDYYSSINKVEKSPIRIEADEVTYNLHIILRTQIENSLINNEIKTSSIEEIWNEKTKSMFGFYPKTKSEGYLQDIHWSDGLIGYFPTYTIGNLISAQFYYKMQGELGKFSQFGENEFKLIYDWFSKNLYSKGNIYSSFDTVKMITGESIKSNYFIEYLKEKYEDIYQ